MFHDSLMEYESKRAFSNQ